MKELSVDAAQKQESLSDAVIGTRERIVRAASQLMQRHGYDGTGIKQISVTANATAGSVYHFFPGGKQELAIAVIRSGEQEFIDELDAVMRTESDPAEALPVFTGLLADGLYASDWYDGCPVATTALGASSRLPGIQAAAAEALSHWHELVFDRLKEAGIDQEEARELAHTVISTLEGAELAAQLSRSREPLDIAGKHLARLIRGTQP
ncbi:TetR/AcrR family transcriptional regulator [Streptomyces sp. ISL-112]|uniref:TetR/AcrR family transcriptional regulator n=1 Tax=unclassified Streptomyces TaxID=2593676 RepID=UPI001BEC0224|nr:MULTISPECIES: TetR/AcrR family transcriptional regulator [unclassified Streptomyces]MBT2430536.1 TetR/AcrR family transcriptional regulator [Streptomyces sp. ISL-112]MBT2466184.1 TetR/AcrR family transcriptional regulator [Streptomyces sp. ISL-63]